MPYHLRYTPYDLTHDLSDFCKKFNRFIVARESQTKQGQECPIHYHCYLESDYNMDTIRMDFLKKLSIPKAGRGRNNKYYMLKEWNTDITYIVKQGNIVASNGFTEEELTPRPPPCSEENLKEKNTELAAAPRAAKKNDKEKEPSFWNQIMYEGMLWEKKHNKKIEIEEALKLITIVYFKKTLPLPHPGDRKRWATSLVMYSKMKWEYTDTSETDKVIEDEVLNFTADHMVVKRA